MKYWIALACSSAAPGFILVTLSIKELQSNFPFKNSLYFWKPLGSVSFLYSSSSCTSAIVFWSLTNSSLDLYSSRTGANRSTSYSLIFCTFKFSLLKPIAAFTKCLNLYNSVLLNFINPSKAVSVNLRKLYR